MRIGEYKLPDTLLERYVKQVLRWDNETDGALRYELERERERLHDELLEAIGLERTVYPAYPNFERALGDYIEDMKPKDDIVPHELVRPRVVGPRRG